jgi:L-ornithine Nalpha-acyltransferase
MTLMRNDYDFAEHYLPSLDLGISKRGDVLGRLGSLIVRLARTADEIDAAQALRHRVFFKDTHGDTDMFGRDVDQFDAFCDHLIVIDTLLAGSTTSKIVGTYRLLREEQAELAGGFYSQSEFDIAGLAKRMPARRILELGRSCVLPQYRTRRSVELLWQGIWACCRQWSIDILCGCASFAGTSPAKHALALSYLHHHALADETWLVKGHPSKSVTMDLMPHEAIHERLAFNAMPPLIKGYLRVGATFGDGAVVDHEFGTTDVFVILPVEQITPRYIAHFGVDATRFS